MNIILNHWILSLVAYVILAWLTGFVSIVTGLCTKVSEFYPQKEIVDPYPLVFCMVLWPLTWGIATLIGACDLVAMTLKPAMTIRKHGIKRVCSKCNQKVPSSASYCQTCGAILRS